MAKLDIDFVLLDESVVLNGFRALMLGAMLDNFKSNPVMLFMHARAEDKMFEALSDDAVLPIGKWYDIRVQGSQLLAKPWFDDNDDFALKVQSKVEGGFMNGASVWIEPIEASEDTALMLPGQRLPTLTKWGLFEASIVDIPNCRSALAVRGKEGNMLKLFAGNNDAEIKEHLHIFLQQNKNEMDKMQLALKLGLSKDADDAAIMNKLQAVVADANNYATVSGEVDKLKTDLNTATEQLNEMKLAADTAKRETLVQGAVEAGKIMAGDKEKYMKLAASDFETTKELLDSIKPYISIEARLAAGAGGEASSELLELSKLSGRDLYLQGKFEKLKALSLEVFKLKYKEYYGTDYKG